MGTVVHEAMIVTCWNGSMIGQAHAKAVAIFGDKLVSPVLPEVTNTYSNFLIQSCGSKRGWGSAEEHREKLAKMVGWLRDEAYTDGSNSFEWVVVQYGNDLDEQPAQVLNLAGYA